MSGTEGLVQIMQAMGISSREQRFVLDADGPNGMVVRRVEQLIRSGEFASFLMNARMSPLPPGGDAMKAVFAVLKN